MRVPAREATAFAPATVGNVAVGFDVLGHALVSAGDTVRVIRIEEPEVRIARSSSDLPGDAAGNTAGAGLLRLRMELDLSFGFEIHVDKGIPLGSGMGGSAASAAAAVLAASELLDAPLTTPQLLEYGMHGEAVASGAYHADNLAPSVLGGLVLVRSSFPPDAVRIPVPAGLCCVVVHPQLRVDTREARGVLPAFVTLRDHVVQSGNLAAVIAGCHSGDLALIGRALRDVVAEPHRRQLVRAFEPVRDAALQAGALGCSLSGSGPSLFAWCVDEAAGEAILLAMLNTWEAAGIAARGWVSPVDAPGARIIARVPESTASIPRTRTDE